MESQLRTFGQKRGKGKKIEKKGGKVKIEKDLNSSDGDNSGVQLKICETSHQEESSQNLYENRGALHPPQT